MSRLTFPRQPIQLFSVDFKWTLALTTGSDEANDRVEEIHFSIMRHSLIVFYILMETIFPFLIFRMHV